MRWQIQNSTAEHEKMMADAVEAFDRENGERTEDDDAVTLDTEEKGDADADLSVVAQREAVSEDEITETESSLEDKKSDNETSNFQGDQINNGMKSENPAFEDEKK